MSELPLQGRTAVVTGVGRTKGIGFAIARRLLIMGASVCCQHWSQHDADQPWGSEPFDQVRAVLEEHRRGDARLTDVSVDLAVADAAGSMINSAVDAFGHLDVLICNHARSGGDGTLAEQTLDTLDAHWQVNARATLLATQAFAAQHDGRDGGRVIWMTSGQIAGPMSNEIAYAASKAALAGVTSSVADDLVDRGILLNTVNPGPVNTGYLDPETTDRPDQLDAIRAHFPQRRFGEPDDPARLISWLVSDEGRWVVGQVISSEGGFRRWG
ncbi:SDR family oxidoreductase [Propionibacteriaceae bacterium Y1700]|uniref:SDR family oxidoreductase n=1 Tax=Microlunatus sp. Y1700 TaxID=3418487 RepID=UPI003DA75F32